MAHNKNRSDFTVGDVDWTKPKLTELLDKVGDWAIDNRNPITPQPVKIRVASDWHGGAPDKHAMLLARMDGQLVLATTFPMPRGGDVEVLGLPGGGPSSMWAVVSEEREGARAEDQGRNIFLSWLHQR